MPRSSLCTTSGVSAAAAISGAGICRSGHPRRTSQTALVRRVASIAPRCARLRAPSGGGAGGSAPGSARAPRSQPRKPALGHGPSADGVSVTGTSELLRSDERLLLADLGMCKDLAVNSGLTVSGGTAGFRPPEQNRPGLVDARADIWSMSALLNWLTQQADLPESFHEVLRRSMSSDPSQRPDDAAEWLAEIEAGLAPPAPELQAPAQEPAPAPDEGPRPRRRPDRPASWCARRVRCGSGGDGAGTGRGLAHERHGRASAVRCLSSSLEIEGPEEAQVGRTVSFEVEGRAWPTGSGCSPQAHTRPPTRRSP